MFLSRRVMATMVTTVAVVSGTHFANPETHPYGGGLDNTFACYITNYLWAVLAIACSIWILLKREAHQCLGAALWSLGMSALFAGICHQYFDNVSSTSYIVTWAVSMGFQILASVAMVMEGYYSMVSNPSPMDGSHLLYRIIAVSIAVVVSSLDITLVGGLCSLASNWIVLAIAVFSILNPKDRTWGRWVFLVVGCWGVSFQAMYFGWWRGRCDPTGLVPETWPEDALFSWEFNHNAWYHVCYIVMTLLLTLSLIPENTNKNTGPGMRNSNLQLLV